jgi:hypothetical protein
VKKVAEILSRVKIDLDTHCITWYTLELLDRAITELQTPRWYTPEQWEEQTGKPWPDDWLVYCLVEESHCRFPPNAAWVFGIYQWAKNWNPHCPVVCATEAGPPPDGWRPEENKP